MKTNIRILKQMQSFKAPILKIVLNVIHIKTEISI